MPQQQPSTSKNSHGGRRDGAGRPCEDKKPRSVTLTDEVVEFAKGLGNGNLSKGIELGLKQLMNGR